LGPAAHLISGKSKGFIPFADAESKFAREGIGKDKSVVCYCDGGISATIDLFVRHQLGYNDLTLYDGSTGEWAKDRSRKIAVTGGSRSRHPGLPGYWRGSRSDWSNLGALTRRNMRFQLDPQPSWKCA
jgi:hypothetical protein